MKMDNESHTLKSKCNSANADVTIKTCKTEKKLRHGNNAKTPKEKLKKSKHESGARKENEKTTSLEKSINPKTPKSTPKSIKKGPSLIKAVSRSFGKEKSKTDIKKEGKEASTCSYSSSCSTSIRDQDSARRKLDNDILGLLLFQKETPDNIKQSRSDNIQKQYTYPGASASQEHSIDTASSTSRDATSFDHLTVSSQSGIPTSKPPEPSINLRTPNNHKVQGRKNPIRMPSPMKSMKKIFNKASNEGTESDTKDKNIDMNIGLRLALPDKIDIMRGLEAPGIAPNVFQNEVRDCDNSCSVPSTPPRVAPSTINKKIIILPEESNKGLGGLRLKSMTSFKLTSRRGNVGGSTSDQLPPSQLLHSCDDSPSNVGADKRDEIVLRSSEIDPSVHQITIPLATDLLVHARVCTLMEGYDRLLESRTKAKKRWFNFGDLVGLSRHELEAMYLSAIGQKPSIPTFVGMGVDPGPPPLPLMSGNPFSAPLPGNPFGSLTHDGGSAGDLASFNSGSTSHKNSLNSKGGPKKKATKPKSVKPHPSTIKSLLECADDILVEGYFTETIGNESVGLSEDKEISHVQASVFSSQRQRQLIVCYRGSMSQHEKPVKTKVSQKDSSGGGSSIVQHTKNRLALNPIFGDAYFESGLEGKILECLDKLSSENPFCDVIFTGHSFGGALSVIGAMRCAEKFPMMTVSCHVFGVPKLGGLVFRHFANSLPNLKVMRVEHGLDFYVDLPLGSQWEHAGHTITINALHENDKQVSALDLMVGTKRYSFNSTSNNEYKFPATLTNPALAYKFGKKKEVAQGGRFNKGSKHAGIIGNNKLSARSKKAQGKEDHKMRSYLHALEQFTHLGLPWVSTFVGEEGDGIFTIDNEERNVV